MSDIVGTPRRIERPAPPPGGGVMTREQGERLIHELHALRTDLERRSRWSLSWTIAWGIVLSTPLAIAIGLVVVFLLALVFGGLGAAIGG